MQKLFIKTLKISIVTPENQFGTLLKFQNGLNIIRADSSTGKTTCLNAILYALGLERMLDREGASLLKPVLKKEVFFDGRAHNVLESFIELEIRNARNQFLTLKRQVVGETSADTIIIFYGAKLSNPRGQYYQEQSYSLRDRDGHYSSQGFYDALLAFLDWRPPLVDNHGGGGEEILPPECILSLIYTDQNHGWNLDNSRFPSFYNLQQPWQTAFEFINALDVGDISRKKRKLTKAIDELKGQWTEMEDFFQSMATEVGGRVHNFPHKPTISYDPLAPPRVMVSQQESWVSLEKLVSSLKEEFSGASPTGLQETPPPKDASLEMEIFQLEKKYATEQMVLTELRDSFFDERENVKFLQEKVRRMEKTLCQLEKDVEDKETEFALDTIFPDKFELLGEKQRQEINVLNNSASVLYALKEKRENLEKQKLAAEILLEAAENNLEEMGQSFEQKNSSVTDLRSRIRHLKKSRPGYETETEYKAQDVFKKKGKIQEFELLIERIDQKTREIAKLSKRWKDLLAEQSGLRKEYHTADDKQKLRKFIRLLIDNVRRFGFSSTDPGALKLSLETYAPSLKGLDIPYDFSSSDRIRLAWAYVIALQQLGGLFPCNHPQVSIFDEPSQQNINFDDKKAFYACLYELDATGNQVLVATSEPPEVMRQLVDARNVNLLNFQDGIILPLGN